MKALLLSFVTPEYSNAGQQFAKCDGFRFMIGNMIWCMRPFFTISVLITSFPGFAIGFAVVLVIGNWLEAISVSVWESVSCKECPTLCNPMDCGPPGSSVHGLLQAGILEWVAIPFSRGSSRPRDWTRVSCIPCVGRRILYQLHHQEKLMTK